MHLKRISAPKIWNIKRKERKYIARPVPGPHKLEECITASILIKDFLGQAKTKKEVTSILKNKKILVNKAAIQDRRYPIGVMDIIEIPDLKEKYILLYNKKGDFVLNHIKDSSARLCKIIGKTSVKKGKIQLNLDNGWNILLDKNNYSVDDALLVDLENKKVKSHLKLEKDALVYFVGGSYKGSIGKLQKIRESEGSEETKIVFSIDNKNCVTLKKYAFVIGREKPLIEVKDE